MKKLLASGLCIVASFGFPIGVAGSPHAKVSANRKHVACVKVSKIAKAGTVSVKVKSDTVAVSDTKPAPKAKERLASKFSSFSAVDKAPPQADESWSSIDSKDLDHVDQQQ